MSDRKNKPSASGFHRLVRCPGSWAAEAGLPSVETEQSISGTKIHASLAGQDVQLDPDEETCRDMCSDIFAKLCETYCHGERRLFVEQRMWWRDSVSAQVDAVAYNGTTALVVDYKTGRGEVDDAQDNYQLAVQALCVYEEIGPENIIVAVIQPWASPQFTVAQYDADAIAAAEVLVKETLLEIEKPDAPRVAGVDQCKYCKARATCPAAINEVKSMAMTPFRAGMVIDPKYMSKLLEDCKLASSIIHEIRSHAKEMLDRGIEIPGWKLSKGQERRNITDITKIFERCVDLGVKEEEFVGLTDIGLGDLEKLIRKVTGKKGKELAETINTVMDGCVEKKATEKSLEKV